MRYSYKGNKKYDISPEYVDFDKQFMNAVKIALENGEGKDYRFGVWKNTLEKVYSGFITIREQGIDIWDECIEEYEKAFIIKGE